ncbi:hypothetical protein Pelo_15165 [Pelomyxa schiedti]|nr:hypothetical protein Pelo_15165 [Pelomyxa schiedti]
MSKTRRHAPSAGTLSHNDHSDSDDLSRTVLMGDIAATNRLGRSLLLSSRSDLFSAPDSVTATDYGFGYDSGSVDDDPDYYDDIDGPFSPTKRTSSRMAFGCAPNRSDAARSKKELLKRAKEAGNATAGVWLARHKCQVGKGLWAKGRHLEAILEWEKASHKYSKGGTLVLETVSQLRVHRDIQGIGESEDREPEGGIIGRLIRLFEEIGAMVHDPELLVYISVMIGFVLDPMYFHFEKALQLLLDAQNFDRDSHNFYLTTQLFIPSIQLLVSEKCRIVAALTCYHPRCGAGSFFLSHLPRAVVIDIGRIMWMQNSTSSKYV